MEGKKHCAFFHTRSAADVLETLAESNVRTHGQCRRDLIEAALELMLNERRIVESDEPYALNRNGRPLQGSYNIDKELHRKLKVFAMEKNMHISEVVNAALVAYAAEKV